MTVDTKERTQWGNAQVQVKEHPRQYKTGKVIVPTYSAKCPNSQRRKRLKKTYGSIYVMVCDGKEVEVDIESGNYVEAITIKVNSYVPDKATLISAEDFERIRQKQHIYGWSQTLFDEASLDIGLLNWWMAFTNKEMTKGVAFALHGDEHIYIKFSYP